MNHVPHRNRDAEEIALAREIVQQHAHEFPPAVTGFDVKLGEFNGDPALWITFETVGDWIADPRERFREAATLNDLVSRVRPSLLDAFADRFPYFRFVTGPQIGSPPA